MDTSVPFGITGMDVAAGDHVCAFYRGLAERDRVLLPYLRVGLEAGDKCICVVDATAPDTVLATLGSEVDVREPCKRGQLDLLASRDAYFPDGGFTADAMLDFWDQSVSTALQDERFEFVRAVGEMTWSLRSIPGVGELVRYEAVLNNFASRYPQVILCLYDIDRFSGEIIMDMLKTHPKVLLGGSIYENPYYIRPEDFLAVLSS
jgi:MEDS: MEthanogen/methylotroph, DcmR Sensory domain